MRRIAFSLIVFCLLTPAAFAASKLEISGGWIRTPPPGTKMLAGYATLRNTGDAPLTVEAASSADFGAVDLHESVIEQGKMHMRPLGEVEIAPGGSIVFAPRGKHFMLMQPKRELKAGDTVKIHLATKGGDGADAQFVVSDDAPATK